MATDQEIRDAGFKYIPQQKYLQNPYNLPIAPVPPAASGGITNIASPRTINNGGNDGFSVYNPDPNSIVNRNADSTRYNNLMENSFLYGGSNATDQIFNPKRLEGAKFKDDRIIGQKIGYNKAGLPFINAGSAIGQQANNLYKLSEKDLNDPFNRLATSSAFPGMQAVDVKDIANNALMDYRQNYGAQGQYEKDNYYDTVDSPVTYNSQTKLDKFKDNYPEYFGLDQSGPKPGIPGAIANYFKNNLLGKSVNAIGNFIGDIAPTNRRKMLENQLGVGGLMVNDIGQFVAGNQGSAYDPSGSNIMAGYNASKVTQNTFDKRRKYAEKNMSTGGFKKFDKALTAAEAIFNKSKKESDFMYDETEEEKNKKKKKGNVISRFLTKKKDAKAVADAQEAQDAKDATTANALRFKQEQDRLAGLVGTRVTDRNTGTSSIVQTESGGNDRGTSRPTDHEESVGLGSNAGNVRAAMEDDDPDTGSAQSYNQNLARGGRAGYFFGGRVNYKIGGRVGFKNGGLASIL